MASTEELLFHLSEKIDIFQVHLAAASAGARRSMEAGAAHLRAAGAQLGSGHLAETARQRWQAATAAAAGSWQHLRETAAHLNPRELAEKFKLIVLTDVSTIHLCLLGVGFGAGLVVGYYLGRRHRAPPSRRTPSMRAVIVTGYLGAEGVEIVEDQPRPEICSSTEVLVRVKAASVDQVDLRLAAGYGRTLRRQLAKYNPHVSGELPFALGRDLAGVVEEVGPQVTLWEPGDPVWAAVPFWKPGTLAEYVVLDEKELARKPDGVTFERAAALPYSGTVAWHALVAQAGLSQETAHDKRVLIHAGASAVGIIAIQLVKAWGGHVTTTMTRRLVPLARMLGADDVIEYDTVELEKEMALRDKFDVVLNTAGAALHGSSQRCCADHGLVVSTVEADLPSDQYGLLFGTLYSLWVRLSRLAAQVLFLPESWGAVSFSPEVLTQLAQLVDARELQAVVEFTFDWRDADAALQYLSRGATVGKPVVSFRHQEAEVETDGS